MEFGEISIKDKLGRTVILRNDRLRIKHLQIGSLER